MTDEDATEALRMHQRPRITDLTTTRHARHVRRVRAAADPVELHMLVSEHFVVTIHDAAISGLASCPEPAPAPENDKPVASTLIVVHQILDSIADGYFPRLSKLDDEIDTVEEEIFDNPTDEQLQRLFSMKRELIAHAQGRDPDARHARRRVHRRGRSAWVHPETSGWLRDAYDHMIRISDLVDSYRDLLTGAMDVYLSTVSNRLNSVMKQLTVIATIFLPLTFVTGFFGQNFSFLTNHIGNDLDILGLRHRHRGCDRARDARGVPPPEVDLT